VQESYPGWIYMLRNGATTLWERWEYIASDGMNSHNHIMLGSVDGWYYQYLAGIRPSAPAWKQIACHPGMFSGLTFAHAAVHTPGGRAELGWERSGDLLKISVTIPPGSEGLLYLPAGYGNPTVDGIELQPYSGVGSGDGRSSEHGPEHEDGRGGERGPDHKDGSGGERGPDHKDGSGIDDDQEKVPYKLAPGIFYITCKKQN